MDETAKIVEGITKYLGSVGGLRREDMKEKFGLGDEEMGGILKFLVKLELIEMNEQIELTDLGLKFLDL